MSRIAFQLTAARRRLGRVAIGFTARQSVSTHSRPKAAGHAGVLGYQNKRVSTHSRPKAAGPPAQASRVTRKRFNSQPPEGGWMFARQAAALTASFNSQPPEGGWVLEDILQKELIVSTHSRPKAAGYISPRVVVRFVCFNSQPPEGGWLPSCSA